MIIAIEIEKAKVSIKGDIFTMNRAKFYIYCSWRFKR